MERPPGEDQQPRRDSGLALGWAALVLLFAASLLTVSAWLVQFARGWWRRARGAAAEGWGEEGAGRDPRSPAAAAALWGLLGRLAVPFRGSGGQAGGRRAEAAEAASGPRALLASLFAFRAFRENWQRAWLRALNEQARRHGSSIQITFEDSPQQLPAVNLSHMTCADHSECTMLLHCHLSTESLQFPILVAQQSPAAVSMDAFQVTLAVVDAQVEIRLEEIQDGGLLVSWAFLDRPDLSLTVVPKLQPREDNDGKVDLSIIKELLVDSVISTQPAMTVNLRAGVAGGTATTGSKRPPHGSPSSPAVTATPRLQVQNLRALHLGPELLQGSRQLCCLVEVDSPRQQKRTKWVPASGLGPASEVEWIDKLVLETSPQSRELKLSIFSCSDPGEEVLLGFTAIPLASPSKEPKKQQLYRLNSGPTRKLPEAAALSVEMLYQDVPEGMGSSSSSLRASITPTKKVEMDRTIMPDGTIVTTVTTIQSRPKMDCKIDSPSRSPSKVEVTEKGTTVLPENGCPRSASPTSSRSSHVSNGLDPVAETAIRQLTDLTHKPTKKTPTKRSTLIISGVSKVPLAQDEMALSLGYAASLDGLLPDDAILAGMVGYAQHTHSFAHPTQPLDPSQAAHELDEALHSDFSERVSVDDAESETGSTGALETRSLKDHKVSFLRSGTKLLFRRKNKPREAGLSLSHDNLPNTSAASGPRKKSGSFSRRLIKHFSFKSKPAAKANGGPLALDRP